eukprot:4202151-Prymnesium_polylepis.1
MQTANALRHVDLFRNGLIPETEPRRTVHFERLRNGPETGRTEHTSIHYRVQMISDPFRYIRLHASSPVRHVTSQSLRI